jgi:hypothetical protein
MSQTELEMLFGDISGWVQNANKEKAGFATNLKNELLA